MSQNVSRSEFTARYFIESPDPLEKAAEVIAGEQSSGTFMSLPGETSVLKARSRARVVGIKHLESASTPALHSAFAERRLNMSSFNRGEVTIAFPVANVGPNIPTLLATVAGNLFELGDVTGIRLLDLDLPESYASQFKGPKFSIEKTRDMAGVFGRPFIGTIIKPSIGMTPEETAKLVDDLCAADIDFIKDDELIADPPYAPFDARLRAVMPVILKHADRMGRKPMYAMNISGSIDDMLRRHDAVVAAGGTCVMVSANWVGFGAVEHLRSHAELPVHGHRNGWGMLTRHPALGFEFNAYQKLWRLAGIDHIHVNGLKNKFWEPDDTVIASARACLSSFSGVPCLMPVFSSGQWAGQAAETYARLNSSDLMHLAGGGIIGHPQGITAGVASLREAWEAAMAGIDIMEYARSRPALRGAIETFGTTR